MAAGASGASAASDLEMSCPIESLPSIDSETQKTSRKRNTATGTAISGDFIRVSAGESAEFHFHRTDRLKSWAKRVTSNKFTTQAMAGVILFDAYCNCGDIDARALGNKAPEVYQVGAAVCLVLYTLEASLVLFGQGLQVLHDRVFLIDLCVIICGYVEMILDALSSEAIVASFGILRLLRLARVMRLLRLLRKSRALRELQKLVIMMSTCMKALIWSFIFCFVIMTVWAMLMVEMVHPIIQDLHKDDPGIFGDCEQCLRATQYVMDANLLLFKTVIAGDSWGLIAVPVIEKHPATAIIFVGSLLTLVFGVLNLIVAVDLLNDHEERTAERSAGHRMGWRTLLPAAVLGLFALVTLATLSKQHLSEPPSSAAQPAQVTDLDASVQSKKAPQLPEGTAPYSRSTVSLPSSASNASKLLPVVMFHGAAESEKEFIQVNHWIRSEHPGTFTVLVNLFTGSNSFSPLEEQVGGLYGYLSRLVEDFPEQFHHGYNLLCHSQGALVCRVAVQVMDHHRVVNFISLAGPQMGVYGTTWLESAQPFLEKNLPIPPLPQFIPSSIMSMGATILASNFHSFAYGSLQNSSSLANLWHDPLHEEDYLKGNAFLPRANGEVGRGSVGKGNFVKLKKAVFLVGSFKDRDYDSKLGLEPWQSGIFGFYKPGTDDELLPMEKQKLFREDAFGLRTLHESGRLLVEAVPNVEHGEWLSSRKVFQRYVLPHLARDK